MNREIMEMEKRGKKNFSNLTYQQSKFSFTYSDSYTVTLCQLSIRGNSGQLEIYVNELLN